MAGEQPLLDLAAAIADGGSVEWETAIRSADTDEERRLLEELRFIAAISRVTTSESPAPATEYTGRVWGPLEIIEHVGRGTFGDVYRAWDRQLDREVALKLLRHQERDGEARASTAVHEGRLLARVRHPNVATVYGAERVSGQVGVWMEFVHGKTLEDILRQQGPFAVDRLIDIGVELSGALAAIHRAGLIHRDVKAQNVLCGADGRLVLTDLGAGCEVEDGVSATGLAGTPISVAPEILDGQAASPQSDVYSLGVLLYHLATGTFPVRGRSLEEIREAHASGRRTPLAEERPSLPSDFARIVDRAIDPNPAQRQEGPERLGAELSTLTRPAAGDRPMGEAGESALPLTSARARLVDLWRWRWAIATAALIGGVGCWTAIRIDTVTNPETELVEVVALTEQGRLEDAFDRARRLRAAHPAAASAAHAEAYVLTYAGFLDDAARAIDDMLAASPDYIEQNGWWMPTTWLYQRNVDRFLQSLRRVDSPSSRLYRALAEAERGRRADAVTHLPALDATDMTVFDGLARALHAGLSGRADEAAATIRTVADRRRTSTDRDGEVTFKQAQILAVAGHAPLALVTLDDAVTQGFVCVACIEGSILLDPVRALPAYRRITERAMARHRAFGERFGLLGTSGAQPPR